MSDSALHRMPSRMGLGGNGQHALWRSRQDTETVTTTVEMLATHTLRLARLLKANPFRAST